MELTVNSATIQFGDGQTVGLLIGFSYYQENENLSGSIKVPLNKVPNMSYENLSKAVKEELTERLNEQPNA